MARLFTQGRFTDFGPSAYLLDHAPPTRIDGAGSRPLRRAARLLAPRRPGVYAMLDAHEQLIYVGKAKNLRTRLLSYFRRESRPRKAGRIIGQARSIVWEVCPSEFVSLLRELELIRRWRPRWNVQGQPLRHRHTFLCVGRAPAYVFMAPRPPRRTLAAFGPLPAGRRTGAAVRHLNDLFRLRDCPDRQPMFFPDQAELFDEDHPPGCIRLELGTCLGPCAGACTRRAYQIQVTGVRAFLTGSNRAVLTELEGQMATAAAEQQYERAAALRDRWRPLRWLAGVLDRLQFAQREMSFVYPITGPDARPAWYLIHGGRTVAVVAAPSDAESRKAAARQLRSVYRSKQDTSLLEPYEHADGMLVVLGWFRRYPEERRRVLTPDAALAACC